MKRRILILMLGGLVPVVGWGAAATQADVIYVDDDAPTGETPAATPSHTRS